MFEQGSGGSGVVWFRPGVRFKEGSGGWFRAGVAQDNVRLKEGSGGFGVGCRLRVSSGLRRLCEGRQRAPYAVWDIT